MVQMVNLHRRLDEESARKLHNELLIEAREKISELHEEHINISREINLAKMMELAVDANEEGWTRKSWLRVGYE